MSYPEPLAGWLAGAEALAGRVAFYANGLDCLIGGQAVTPEPGGLYGGWITPDLAGPIKGGPAAGDW